eukprot:comp20281_c0_seq1/m.25434 comp20281_c0_seq1/g.25434  ORF comp20281_c0_seq1/g.25434 comp20281_c0_seq1/m.25434 type:complete len:522 (-) comp20281_c0_seq1:305-1870(-)
MSGLHPALFLDQSLITQWVCDLCSMVAEHPCQTNCKDGHVFCHKCLVDAFEDSGVCPAPGCDTVLPSYEHDDPPDSASHAITCYSDRPFLTLEQMPPMNRRLYWCLEMHCTNQEAGCPATCTLNQLQDHLDGACAFQPLPCTNEGCEALVWRKDHKAHVEGECGLRSVHCKVPMCEEVVKFRDLAEHTASCRTTCTCGKIFASSHMDKHKDTDCPDTEVQCEIGGCPATMRRGQIDDHMVSATAEHVRLLARQTKTLMETMEERVKEQVQERVKRTYEEMEERQAKKAREMESRVKAKYSDFEVFETAAKEKIQADIAAGLLTTKSDLVVARQILGVDLPIELFFPEAGSVDYLIPCLTEGTLVTIKGVAKGLNDEPGHKHLTPTTTLPCGYAFQLCVYFNGRKAASDSISNDHVSLFYYPAAGRDDDNLEWPFMQRVTVTILDHSPARKHKSASIDPREDDDVCEWFKSLGRPEGGNTKGQGWTDFMERKELTEGEEEYVVGDTLWIWVHVTDVTSVFEC